MRNSSLASLFLLVALTGCPDPETLPIDVPDAGRPDADRVADASPDAMLPPDGDVPDAEVPDAQLPDAGADATPDVPDPDASPPDATPPPDASPPDATLPPDAHVCVPSAELCNELDDDCDGTVDEECLPPTPVARFPWNGLRTGSPFTPATSAVQPLRPRFSWDASPGAEYYRFQLTDECVADGFANCAFAHPIANDLIGMTSFQTSRPLPVATTAPVGRRYYWRVAACVADRCGPFGETRYVDVGRVPGDVNGDGYGDLMVGAPREGGRGRNYVHQGGLDGVSATPTTTLVPPAAARFGGMDAVGDLNADGFDDVCIGGPESQGRDVVSYVFLGSAAGLPAQRSQSFTSPVVGGFVVFGDCFGVGDFDADGHADVVLGSNEVAYVYPGGPEGVDPGKRIDLLAPVSSDSNFGFAGAALGDIDADGYTDFAIGAEDERIGGQRAGAVYIYRGGPGRPSDLPAQQIRNTVHPERRFFGRVLEGGRDIDGDGFADAVFGPATGIVGTPYPNAVYVYRGSPAGLSAPVETLFSPYGEETAFGSTLSLGDANGDGQVDLLAGDSQARGFADERGAIALFQGAGGRLGPDIDVFIENPTGQTEASFGVRVKLCDLDGDGDDELIANASRQDHPADHEGALFVFRGGAAPETTPMLVLDSPTNLANGAFGWPGCGGF